MHFVFMFKTDILGGLFESGATMDKLIFFLLPGGTLKLYFEKVLVLKIIEYVKLAFSEHS